MSPTSRHAPGCLRPKQSDQNLPLLQDVVSAVGHIGGYHRLDDPSERSEIVPRFVDVAARE